MLLKKYLPIFAYLLIAGLLFAIAVPPFQKPDENRHYFQAMAISRGQLGCKVDQQGKIANPLPQYVLDFPDKLKVSEIAHTPDQKFTPNLFRVDFNLQKDDMGVESTWCSYSPVGYIPSSLGLLLGRVSNNLYFEFYTARVFALLLFILSVYYSLKITEPRFHSLIIVFAALPMTLHQVTAISYDALILILVPLAFAEFTTLLFDTKPNKRVNLWVFILALMGIILSKPAYAPLMLLIFTVYKLLPASLIAVVGGLLTLPFLKPAYYQATPSGADAAVQLELMRRDPVFLLRAITNTIVGDSQAIYEGLIGNFGWLDYKLHYALYLLFFGLFVWVVRSPKLRQISNSKFLILGISIVASITAIFTSLYIIWTPVGANVVGGVQGRYFLPLIPFILFWLIQLIYIIRKYRLVKVILSYLISMILTAILGLSIYSRYYDYSKSGFNEVAKLTNVEMETRVKDLQDFELVLPANKLKLAGFYFYHSLGNTRPQQYRYQILDSNCQRKLYQGYLQCLYQESTGLFVERINPFWVNESKLCVRLEPMGDGQELVLNKFNGFYIHPYYLVPSLR